MRDLELKTFNNETDDYDFFCTINNKKLNIYPNFEIREVLDFYQRKRLTADPYYSEPEVIETHLEIESWGVGSVWSVDEKGDPIEVTKSLTSEEWAECKKECKKYVESLLDKLDV